MGSSLAEIWITSAISRLALDSISNMGHELVKTKQRRHLLSQEIQQVQ